MASDPIEAGELLRRWQLPQHTLASGHEIPAEVGSLFRLRAQPGGVPQLNFPGLGAHFAIGCRTDHPGPSAQAWFGADANTGVVRFARHDTGGGFQQPVFVNRDLYAFADALRLRDRLIDRLDPAAAVARPDEVTPLLLAHVEALWQIDPAALADRTGYWVASIWPMWVEWAPDPEPFSRFLTERRART